MKSLLRIAGALVIAIIGAIAGAMLTTPYADLRKNGASYLPALGAGFRSLWAAILGILHSPWFLIPVGAVVLVVTTMRITLQASRPKNPDPYISLGMQMNYYINMAHHDQKFRHFTTHYRDTMRVCSEFQAFVVQVQNNGIPTPSPQSNRAEEWIDLCCEYFTAVAPFLRSNDFANAVAIAQGFADRHPYRRLS